MVLVLVLVAFYLFIVWNGVKRFFSNNGSLSGVYRITLRVNPIAFLTTKYSSTLGTDATIAKRQKVFHQKINDCLTSLACTRHTVNTKESGWISMTSVHDAQIYARDYLLLSYWLSRESLKHKTTRSKKVSMFIIMMSTMEGNFEHK